MMSIEEWKSSMADIGQNIASVYGAEYEDCEILANGDVRFYYNDHGDCGYCDVEPCELKNWR